MSTTTKHVLLFGEPIIVAEYARLLETKSIDFMILNSIEEFTDSLSTDDIINEALNEVFPPSFGMGSGQESEQDAEEDVNEYYDEFHENVVMSIQEFDDDDNFDVIIDCSVKSHIVKVLVLQELAELFPSALIMCSTVVTTATHVNSLLPLASQVVGVPLIPGFSSFSTIEMAPSLRTREITHTKARQFLTECGFTVEKVEDRTGLVFPRMIAMLINEAAFAVMENVATPQDIDNAMKLGVNYPKGLLEWADQIGIDIVVGILDALHNEYQEPRYRCCTLLRQYMHAGWLGKSTGRGFYHYLPMN